MKRKISKKRMRALTWSLLKKRRRPYRIVYKYWVAIKWSAAIALVWSLSGIVIMAINTPDGAGTFGDMFGSINALFSGLAFAGLIYTMTVQRKELKLQRKELAMQREEIKQSTHELEGQKNMMVLQRFESTLFNLLNTMPEVYATLKFEFQNITPEGRTGLKLFYEAVLRQRNSNKSDLKKVFDGLLVVKQINSESFFLYCSRFFYMLKYVEDADIPESAKTMYLGLINASFLPYEIELITLYASGNDRELLSRYKAQMDYIA